MSGELETFARCVLAQLRWTLANVGAAVDETDTASWRKAANGLRFSVSFGFCGPPQLLHAARVEATVSRQLHTPSEYVLVLHPHAVCGTDFPTVAQPHELPDNVSLQNQHELACVCAHVRVTELTIRGYLGLLRYLFVVCSQQPVTISRALWLKQQKEKALVAFCNRCLRNASIP
eukprot:2948585-Amphidinium_carterae.1